MQNIFILLTVILLTAPFKCQIFHIYREVPVIWLSISGNHLPKKRAENFIWVSPVWGKAGTISTGFARALGFRSSVIPSSRHQDQRGHSQQFLYFWGKETRPKGGRGMLHQILCCWRTGETLSRGAELSGVPKYVCLLTDTELLWPTVKHSNFNSPPLLLIESVIWTDSKM